MASSNHSGNHDSAPLNRWTSRFWILTKPMFWLSSSVLLLTGGLIVDYYRVSVSPDELKAENLSDSQAIPLADDSELQDFRQRSAQESSVDNEIGIDPSSDAIATELDDGTPNVSADDESVSDESELDAGDLPEAFNDSLQQRDRPDQAQTDPFANYVTRADGVLDRMGLTPSNSSASSELLSLPSNPGLLLSPANVLGQEEIATTSQASPLQSALQSLSTEANSALNNSRSEPDTSDQTTLEQSLEAMTPSSESDEQTSAIPEGSLNSLLGIQTAPLPGTTGYTQPAPLPQVRGGANISGTVSGNSVIAVPSIPSTIGPPVTTGIAPTNFLPNSAIAPIQSPLQPTIATPQGQAALTAPSPVFPPTAQPEEHVPYTGGGRDGRINTFANP